MPPGGPVLEKDGQPKKDKNGMLIGAAGGLATGAFGKMLIGKAKKKALKQAGRFDQFQILQGNRAWVLGLRDCAGSVVDAALLICDARDGRSFEAWWRTWWRAWRWWRVWKLVF